MKTRKNYLEFMAMLGWFALVSQFILLMQSGRAGSGELVIRYFSYYTILTNLLVATMATSLLAKTPTAFSRFFSKPTVQTAITLYLTVVGITYNIILRQLQDLEGFPMVINELLHLVIPLLLLFYWWKWVYTKELLWKDIPVWLIYPAVYALFVMWRGSFSGFYPYPFLDVTKLGYPRVWENSGGMVLLFVLFAFLFVFTGRKKEGK